ncbi:MAG TPA: hypothetical protein VHL11_17840, partial [Phototrophicaceae bacterium]|nr:hypothetical protein [Phototrophicaceae bacterium]
AVVGVIIELRQRRSQATIGLLLTITGVGFAALITWSLQTEGTQGRLLFPYMAAISTLLATGLTTSVRLIPERIIPIRPSLIAGRALIPLILFALAVPFITLLPEYTPPAPIARLPDTVQKLNVNFKAISLIGYHTEDRLYQPGDTIPITLYWQPGKTVQGDLTLYLHLIDPHGNVISKIDTYPGWGRLLTSHWQISVIYPDSYFIPLTRFPEDTNFPSGSFPLRIQIGWWNERNGNTVNQITSDGQTLASVILPVGAYRNPQSLTPALNWIPTPPVDFGNKLRLRGYTWDHQTDQPTLSLLWETLDTMSEDYRVLAMVLQQPGTFDHLIAQGDAPPDLPTHYWRKGETFITRHTLVFTGEYPVYIGWYRVPSLERLPVNAPANAYLLGTLSSTR